MLSGAATLSNCFSLPSEKGSNLKGKNLLPLGANSFLSKETLFQNGLYVQRSRQLQKLFPFENKGENLRSVLSPLKVYKVQM